MGRADIKMAILVELSAHFGEKKLRLAILILILMHRRSNLWCADEVSSQHIIGSCHLD